MGRRGIYPSLSDWSHMEETLTIPEWKKWLGNLCGKHRTASSLTDIKAAVVVLVKGHWGEERAHGWGHSDVCDRSSGNFSPCYKKYSFHHVCLWCTICLCFRHTGVSILHVQVVLCYCTSGKWQGLASLYSEDTKSVVEAADPEGPGMLLGRRSMSLNNPI